MSDAPKGPILVLPGFRPHVQSTAKAPPRRLTIAPSDQAPLTAASVSLEEALADEEAGFSEERPAEPLKFDRNHRPTGARAAGVRNAGARAAEAVAEVKGTRESTLPLLDLPSRLAEVSFEERVWFVCTVVVPILAASIYYGLIASNQYVSEFRFSVRPADTSASESSAASALNAVFGSMSGGIDTIDNYTVANYITSPQAVHDLEQKLDLRQMFTRANVDWFSRLRVSASEEKLDAYWQSMVYSTYDPATGLAEVSVRAFTPADAKVIATTLQSLSEKLVNDIGQRSRLDGVRFAELEVNKAEAKLLALGERMRRLRDQADVIDPQNSIIASNIQLASALRSNLTQMETQIAYLTRQLHNSRAPELVSLRAQIDATRGQLKTVDAEVNEKAPSGSPLSKIAGEFEDIDLERQDEEQILLGDLTNLQNAQAEADSQHLYLTSYVEPMRPQSSTFPHRWMMIGIIALGGFIIWIIGGLLANAIMDHGD